ncbi:hypothetical protein CEXT_738931 [Caerostris extrusa]|uniref:Uncharacterized protein n=1 Tax=Caerostris extrusa TaxID=172846 RepID=A0AAV4WB37_CAEEX|nr:hypothetical protein CEXT_738931 [Caerostris extrusa]
MPADLSWAQWNGLHVLGAPTRRLLSRRTSPVPPRYTPSPALRRCKWYRQLLNNVKASHPCGLRFFSKSKMMSSKDMEDFRIYTRKG